MNTKTAITHSDNPPIAVPPPEPGDYFVNKRQGSPNNLYLLACYDGNRHLLVNVRTGRSWASHPTLGVVGAFGSCGPEGFTRVEGIDIHATV